MADRLPVPPAIGAVIYPPDQSPEALLAEFAADLMARGFRVGGLLQRTRAAGDGAKCAMDVIELDSGRRLGLTQDLGPASTSCSFDAAALAEASGALRRAVAAGADVVLANKFAKAEAQGGGLAAEMLQAMAAGIPLLTALPAAYLADWLRFTGGGGDLLAPTRAALWRWWGPERLVDDLILGVADTAVSRVVLGRRWVMVQGAAGVGLAPRPPDGGDALPAWAGLGLADLAAWARSWQPLPAAVGLAAVNAHYNTPCHGPLGDAAALVGGLGAAAGGWLEIGEHAVRPFGAGDSTSWPPDALPWLLPGAEGAVLSSPALTLREVPALLRRAGGRPLVLSGPSVPLSARLADYGVAAALGVVVTDADGLAAALADARAVDPVRFGYRAAVTA